MNKYAFLIGVDKYQYLPDEQQLFYVAEDVRRMSEVLKNICGFNSCESTTGTDTNYENLSKKLKEFFRKAYEPDTLLLLYFSGHGFLNEDQRKSYLGCYNTKKDDGLIFNALEMRTLREDYLEECLYARQLLIILDCCYSGAFIAKGKTNSGDFLKAVQNERLDEVKTGVKEAKGNSSLTRASGLLAACGELEGAFPTEDKQMSRYTKCLVEALKGESPDAHQNGEYSATTISRYLHKQFESFLKNQCPIASGKNHETIVVVKKELKSLIQPQPFLPNPLKNLEDSFAKLVNSGEDIWIKNMLSQLSVQYLLVVEACKHLAEEDILARLQSLLQGIKESGKTVSHPDQRTHLATIAEELGKVIFAMSGNALSVQIEPPAPKIEFVNRISEKQAITTIYSPHYLLISAPMGYGKTKLLKEVIIELQQSQWLCVSLELSRQKSYSIKELTHNTLQQLGKEDIEFLDLSTSEKAGFEISRCLLNVLHNSHRQIAMIVDNAEALRDSVQEFFNQFIVSIKEGLSIADNSIRFRIIIVGRYISHWKLQASKISLEQLSLTPFDFPAVYETVENFAVRTHINVAQEYKQSFAACLMAFTGGHPGCMATILRKDFGVPIRVIIVNEQDYYNTIIMPVVQEIKNCIPDKLERVFETLSVVRRFNPRLLSRLLEKGIIEWIEGDEYDLESSLLKTFLVNKKDGFLYDDITRRIWAIHFRKTNLGHYIEICEESIAFYQSELQGSKSHNPVKIAIEFLFQKLQYLCYKQHGNKEQFIEGLPEILNMLVAGRYAQEVIDAFIQELRDDWEFRFTFNYLLRKDSYHDDDPFQELIEQITTFGKNL